MASAYSHELAQYGIKNGLTNYAAGYATGLLCTRRLLTKLNLADTYKGQEEPNGEDFLVEESVSSVIYRFITPVFNDQPQEDGPRPFRAYLDVGLAPTTTGARIFGVMKGAVDGGLAIPHNNRRFPGYDTETKQMDAEVNLPLPSVPYVS